MQTTLTRVHAPREGTRPFTAETLWSIPRVGSPIPSPDGSAAVVAVVTYDVETDKGRARLWIVPADGSPPRALTSPEADSREASWSPDGRSVCFLRKGTAKDAKAQVHVIAVDGGESEALTTLPVSAFDPKFTPDGAAIVFGARLLRGFPSIAATAAELERREKEPCKAIVTEEPVFRYWDQWLEGGEAPHLFRLDLAKREVRDLIPGSALWFDWMEPAGQFDVAPDGRDVAFSGVWFDAERGHLRSAVFVVPMTGGEPRCLTRGEPHTDFRPRWSRDGKSLVWGAQEDPEFYADRVRLRRWDRASGRIETILGATATPWELSPGGWEFGDDGALWFIAEKDARGALFRWDGTSPPVAVVAHGHCAGARPARDGAVWFSHDTLSDVPEVHRLVPGAGAPRRLSHFTDDAFGGVALGEVMELRFAGAEGAPVQAFVVLPPGPRSDAPLALVQLVHGGPHGIFGDQFHPRWNAHVFAQQGHAVALVNFQGSTSWGQDFAQRIQGAWGARPFTDVMNATDALVALGIADPARLAAAGGSYGGYMMAWIAGHTDRFTCLVNHAGVFDSWTQYASDVNQGRARAFGGEPWDRMDELDRWSAARYAKDMVTPMLVTHGEKDYRVPVAHAFECYSILKCKGVPARLVYFPDENHWILKPRNSLLWHREVFAWFARWLGPGS